MFKRKGGGGQRPFEQCSKKLHFSLGMASLKTHFELWIPFARMWRRKREPLLKSWSCHGSKGAQSVQESHFWTRRANVVDYSAINHPIDQFKATFSLQQLWASSVGHDACTKWPRLMGRGTGLNNLQTLLRAYTQYSQICCCFLFLNKGRRKELSKGKQLLQGWPEEITFPFFCPWEINWFAHDIF